MAKSIFYKCPRCNTPLEIEAELAVENLEMEYISVSVHCPTCNETRYDDVDGYNIETLIAKMFS